MSVLTATSLAGSSTAIDLLPSPEELPAHTVAVVSHVPAESRTLTTFELSRGIAQSAAQSGLKATPTPGQPRYDALEEAALGELLDGLWILGQAKEMGISVTDKQVSVELAQIKEGNFKTKQQFRAFLEKFHLTLRDVRYRVELQLLSVRIEERLARGIRSQKEAQEKFSAFVAAYTKRWRSRTVCTARYVTNRCSNGPAPPSRSHPPR